MTNGNDILHVASLNAGNIIPKDIPNFRFLGGRTWNYQNATSCIKLIRDLLNKSVDRERNPNLKYILQRT